MASEGAEAQLIVLFGWGGSTFKQLQRYEHFYKKEGYGTFSYISPFVIPKSLDSVKKYALDFLERSNFENQIHRLILFHVFSMSGISTFWSIWEELDNKPYGSQIKNQVVGVIFDSCPSNVPRPSVAAEAIANGQYPPTMRDLSSSIKRTGKYTSTWLYYTLRSYMSIGQSNENSLFHRLSLRSDLPSCQLYLYSINDRLIDYRHVEDFIEIQRKKGVNIETKRWNESGHVQHFPLYPQEYQHLCLRFANRLLQNKKSKI
ncbi:Transmembrane protein 53 [Aphelenchoides besseyi]|nr:Transmembrane protein 53 [Aphelenchoides besseyi]KAI6193825.1 Transmembrane protein 53 [Aphelenchoides besseyi]